MKRRIAIALAVVGIMSLLTSAPAQASDGGTTNFKAEAIASGLTVAQAINLQKRVDEVLTAIPGGTQVSPTEIKYDGLDVIVDPYYPDSLASTNVSDCAHGWFCIEVRGTRFNFYTCQTWTLSNWWGVSPFNNNQTQGTLAQAFGPDGYTVVFAHRAKGSGSVDTAPWWYFKPC